MPRRTMVMFALAAAAAAAPFARAQTVQNVLAEAGVLGRWAIDCSRPPSNNNVHTIYAPTPSGDVTVTYDYGAGLAVTVNRLLTARQIEAERVSYRQENEKTGLQLDVVVTVTPTNLRVWSSTRTSGEMLVRDGKFTATGAESPLQARCN